MRRPTPGAAFRWSDETWGASLRCATLEPLAPHLFTTQQQQLRLAEGETAWSRVAATLGGELTGVWRIKQVHGSGVRVVRAAETAASTAAVAPEADAVIANLPGAILAVQVADCVPMLLVDRRTGAAAAVHAGWRGTRAGIAGATVAALAREFSSVPADLHAAIGPSIGACCYEVGAEVFESFRQSGASDRDLARWFTRSAQGSLRLDLWAANRDQLIAAGVAAEQVAVARLCTQTHADVFDSYRVAGPRAGRMLAAVRVPAAG